MPTLVLAFGLFAAIAMCVYRTAFGPQQQLAKLGLVFGALAACCTGLAYPNEQSLWLFGTVGMTVALGLVAAVLVGTSVAHWWRTTPSASAADAD